MASDESTRRRRGRPEVDAAALGRHPGQQRRAAAQRGQRSELAGQAAIAAHLELADRQGRAAERVGQQILVAAPGLDRDVIRRPSTQSASARRTARRCPDCAAGRKRPARRDRRTPATDSAAGARRAAGLPERPARSRSQSTAGQLLGVDRLRPQHCSAGSGAIAAASCKRPLRPADPRTRSPRVAAAACRRRTRNRCRPGSRRPESRPCPSRARAPVRAGSDGPSARRDGPVSSTVTSERAPSISNCTGSADLFVAALGPRQLERDQQLGPVARCLAGGRRSRAPTGWPAPVADRPAGETARPAATRETRPASVGQRPLSAFQSFSRRSEQIQISVRPVWLSRM